MNLNKLFSALIVGIILVAMSPLVLVRVWPKINDVQTGGTPEYPDLQPQRFTGRTVDEIFDAALAVAEETGWEIREVDRGQRTGTALIEAVATVPVFRFRDDVTITITAEPPGPGIPAVVVNIRSRSRVGKSDLGENARRIRRFQAALAAKYPN